MINSAEQLIKKTQDYDINDFQNDFQNMIDAYNNLSEVDQDKIRNEIYKWDFSLDKDSLSEFEKVCEAYARYVEYQNRILFIADQIKTHSTLLEFIVKNTHDIGSQFFEGTAKNKDAKTSTMLIDVNLLKAQIDSLLNFIITTQKSIEFNCQQLARILREREAINKINQSYHTTGISHKFSRFESQDTVKTKNKF